MESEGKTSVDYIQEILANLSTRKDFTQKISAVLQDTLSRVLKQTDEFSGDLLEELSNYGDGTSGISDRENSYQSFYKQVLPTLEDLPVSEARQVFAKMETELLNHYHSILENKESLPESLAEIISQQRDQLESSQR